MYLACTDKVIEEKQNALKAHNDKLIAEHNKLPFWRRFLEDDNLKEQITTNWTNFNKWMDRRMKEQWRKSLFTKEGV